MYADHDPQVTNEYPQIVICTKCQRDIHLKDNEVPYLYNSVQCPICGRKTILIRPGKPKEKTIDFLSLLKNMKENNYEL